MKFLFISTMRGWPWGGSEELWSQAAARLKQAGHDVRVFFEFRPQLSNKLTDLAKLGIRVDTYPMPPHMVGTRRRILDRISLSERRSHERLRRFRPDLVIISQGYNAGGFEWAKVCRDASLPYVIVVQCNNDIDWFPDSEIDDAIASYKRARRVFCVSRGNLDQLRVQLGEALINGEVAFNPFNVSTDPPPPWPADAATLRMACVARMDLAAKGQDLLLQILARPEWRARPVEVDFFGNGIHELALHRMAELLDVKTVHFRGHVSNIRAIWEENHVLVLPSRYEGLPLALVEAMWCGRPAVVTDVAGNAELCLDGQTGFVAPAATTSSFNDALELAWKRRSELPRMGHAARARVEAEIPKDPIAFFCDRLTSCASAEPHAASAAV